MIKLGKYTILTIFLVILAILIFNNNEKSIKNVQNLNNIEKPIQTKTTGSILRKIYNTNVEIKYIATYNISGRVVAIENYYGSKIINQLSTKDVGISWGFLANEENHKKIRWSLGNRYLSWHTNDGLWINQVGGTNSISIHCSNNHLIPSDEKTKNLINKIKEEDYINIEGYLVNVSYKESNGSTTFYNTSTSRSDDGKGSCEIIYVTNITWLQEYKN